MKYAIKNIPFLLILMIGIIISTTSCKEDDIGAFTPKTPELNLSTYQLTVPKTESEHEISVESNLPWRAKSDVNWIIIDEGYALESAVFTVKIEPNYTVVSRIGTITVWITEDASAEIKVNQEKGELPPELKVVYHVKATADEENDGLSWETATTLDKALSLSLSGDTIYLAAGTYIPTKTITGGKAADDADKTFEISKNIALVGGFPTHPVEGDKADPATNSTVLSGNTGSGNAYHTMAVTAPMENDKAVFISGITIRDGEANATSTYVTINGVKFQRNYAGGLIIGRAKVEFENCIISNNRSLGFVPGIYVVDAAHATFTKCDIINNTGTSNGGALWNDNSTVFLNECTISGNSNATGVAAGVYGFNTAGAPTYTYMYNTTISGNTAGAHNAGYYGRVGSIGVMVNCTVYGNAAGAAGDGGGINLHGGGELDIISSTITGNAARNGGGIRCQAGCTVNIKNSIISGNTATGEGNDFSNVGTSTTFYTIISNKTYDADGNEVAGAPAFDFSAMLAPLANNGGSTKTCALTGDNNPAETYGMSTTQLEGIAGTYSPAIPLDIITFDQNGKSRSDKTAIGAVIK